MSTRPTAHASRQQEGGAPAAARPRGALTARGLCRTTVLVTVRPAPHGSLSPSPAPPSCARAHNGGATALPSANCTCHRAPPPPPQRPKAHGAAAAEAAPRLPPILATPPERVRGLAWGGSGASGETPAAGGSAGLCCCVAEPCAPPWCPLLLSARAAAARPAMRTTGVSGFSAARSLSSEVSTSANVGLRGCRGWVGVVTGVEWTVGGAERWQQEGERGRGAVQKVRQGGREGG